MKERILLFDIETAPLISETWGYYEQNVLLQKYLALGILAMHNPTLLVGFLYPQVDVSDVV